jgi:hypothetical protein
VERTYSRGARAEKSLRCIRCVRVLWGRSSTRS